jgi:hypothetical protein
MTTFNMHRNHQNFSLETTILVSSVTTVGSDKTFICFNMLFKNAVKS